jgi:polyhydroxyalkanoate synthesis repressor PhaR
MHHRAEATENPMTPIRTIKKYPNRRLYDTQDSRYITLQDVRELVIKAADFEVIDKKTGENITRCILLQVISEQEQQGQAVMSEDFLAQVIRAYEGSVPNVVRHYLERTLKLFVDQQQSLADDFQATTVEDPVIGLTELARGSMNKWLNWQKQVLNGVQPSGQGNVMGAMRKA